MVFQAHLGVALSVVGVGLPAVVVADQNPCPMIPVGGITNLSALSFDTVTKGAACLQQMAECICADFIEVLQDEFSEVTVNQRLRGHIARAAALVDTVGNGHEHLGPRDAPGHRVRKEHILARRDQTIQLAHHLLE